MNYDSIGKNIRSYRIKRKLRQEDLAEITDLSVTYIGMVERGEKIPALETFIKILPQAPIDLKYIIELDRRGSDDCVFYQCDNHEFDAYVEKFGFQNLNILYNQMAKATQVKYRAYADYLSNTQTRPLFKGCANDYFFALRSLLLKCVPFLRIDEDAVMRFHKFADTDELPF